MNNKQTRICFVLVGYMCLYLSGSSSASISFSSCRAASIAGSVSSSSPLTFASIVCSQIHRDLLQCYLKHLVCHILDVKELFYIHRYTMVIT